MIIARLAGVTWSVTAHAFDIYTTNPSLRRKLREAAFFVTCTAYNVNYLSQLVPRDRRVAVHLSYHGIDTTQYEFHPHAAVEPLRLLAVGRLTETKGFPHLIEAVRILGGRERSVALKIIGDGPMRGSLENIARSGGVAEHVEFAGAMSHESVISEMKKADALVAPSVIARNGDRDGMPNVIAEAMALGLPVVASNLSGIPEFVHDGLTGLLVPPGDANGIADAVEKIANDGDLRMKIVRNARSLVEDEFDVETNVSALLQLFEGEVIGAGRAKEAGALHH
jgi:glycosyltransferase involved in cell wall biosynthesis